MNRRIHGFLLALLAGGLLACSAPLAPIRIETGPKAEVTPEGLHRIRTWQRSVVGYVRPGADFGHYNAVLLELVSISYQHPPKRGGGIGRNNFQLSAGQLKQLEKIFRESFFELRRSRRRTLATEPGPDVLRIDARLVDLVVSAPPAPVSARDDVFVQSMGAVTLVLDLRDSQTGEILARFAERGTASQAGMDGISRSTPGASQANLRRLFRTWASTLAQRLDQLREQGPISGPATGS